MTREGEAGTFVIEPFDPEKHDRTAFSCGVEQVDNFFKKTMNKLSRANNIRAFVLVGPGNEPIGFYAVNAHSVDYGDLPEKYARTRPGHGRIPAAYISMIGVDRRYAGRGFGGDLLVDALSRIAGVADSLGLAVVILDILDCGNPALVAKRKALYESYGFVAFPSNPLRLFLPLATIHSLLDARSELVGSL